MSIEWSFSNGMVVWKHLLLSVVAFVGVVVVVVVVVGIVVEI